MNESADASSSPDQPQPQEAIANDEGKAPDETTSDAAPATRPTSLLVGGGTLARFSRTVNGCALTGGLLALTFHPFALWQTARIAFVPWFVVLAHPAPSRAEAKPGNWFTRAFLRPIGRNADILVGAFVLGAIWFLLTLGWLANPDPDVGMLALGGTVGALCLQLFLTSLFLRAFLRRGTWLSLSAVVATWVVLEFLKTVAWSPVPFPWLQIGSSQVGFLPAAQIADLGGTWLLGGLIVTVNVCLALPLVRRVHGTPATRWWLAPAVGVALFGASLVYGTVRIAQVEAACHPGPKIAVTQPNFVFNPAKPAARPVRIVLGALSIEAWQRDVDIICWPEAMVFGYVGPVRAEIGHANPQKNDEATLRRLVGVLQSDVRMLHPEIKRPVHDWPYMLFGTSFDIPEYHPSLVYPSSGRPVQYDQDGAHLMSPPDENGEVHVVGYYAKRDLVPAGEYIPYATSLPFIGDIVMSGMGGIPMVKPGNGPVHMSIDTSKTPWAETPTHPVVEGSHVYTFATPICYEMAFGPTIRSHVAGPSGASRPADFLLNISDDSWYQRSAELDQMLAMSQLRAIENRRGIARSTNTGISSFIRPTGEVRDRLEIDGRVKEVGGSGKKGEPLGLLVGRIDVTDAFSLYTATGDWFAWLCCLVMAAGVLLPWIRRDPATP